MSVIFTILLGVGGLIGIAVCAFWAIAVIMNKYL